MTATIFGSKLILQVAAENPHLSEAERIVNTILAWMSDAFADGNR